MLPTKLFITQIFFFQAINYFKHNNFVKTDESAFETILPFQERIDLILSKCVIDRAFRNWKTKDIFPNQDYIVVATFDKKLINIDSLKTKLSGATLKVLTEGKGIVSGTKILETNIENIQLDFGEPSQNSTYFQITITKSDFNKILDSIKKSSPKHEVTEVSLRLSENENILLFKILLSEKGDILYMKEGFMYNKDCTELNELSAKTPLLLHKYHKEIFMRMIELFKRKIDGNNTKISNVDDEEIRIHFDEMPTLLLCNNSIKPHVQFFNRFIVEIYACNDEISEKKRTENFKYNPSVAIKFSKNRETNYKEEKIYLQITEYEYDKKSEQYSVNDESSIIYKNINFIDTKITSQQLSANLHTTIQTPKTTPIIEMSFVKEGEGLFYRPEAYELLKNSIYKIIISICEEKDLISIYEDSFTINNDEKVFSIKFDPKIFSKDELLPIKSMVEKRDGVFRIVIQSKKGTIIESIICLDDDRMITLSTNRLIEHLRENGFKNGDGKPLNSENSQPEKNILLNNLHKKDDIDPSKKATTLTKNTLNTSGANSSPRKVSAENATGNKKLHLILLSFDNTLSNTQNLQGQSNLNFKTSNNLAKSIFNTKSESRTTALADTPANKKSNSRKKL